MLNAFGFINLLQNTTEATKNLDVSKLTNIEKIELNGEIFILLDELELLQDELYVRNSE